MFRLSVCIPTPYAEWASAVSPFSRRENEANMILVSYSSVFDILPPLYSVSSAIASLFALLCFRTLSNPQLSTLFVTLLRTL